jgi:hypothetical protein
MTDDLLSNPFASLIAPASVLAEIKTRGGLGALKGRVVRKLAAGDAEEDDLEHGRVASPGGTKLGAPIR